MSPQNNMYVPEGNVNIAANPHLPMFQELTEQAMGGSIQNFNRAAGRLREGVAGEAGRASQQITNQNLSRGMGNSGFTDAGLRDVQMARVGAFGDGLIDLERDFEDSRLRGLESAINATRAMSEDHQFGETLLETIRNNLRIDAKDRDLSADKILADLMMNDNTTSSNAAQMQWLQNLIASLVGGL